MGVGDKRDRHPGTYGLIFLANVTRMPGRSRGEDKSASEREHEGEPHHERSPRCFSHAEFKCKPGPPRIGLNVRMERALSSEVAPVTEESGGPLDNFETLVEQHRPRIFRFILASLRN